MQELKPLFCSQSCIWPLHGKACIGRAGKCLCNQLSAISTAMMCHILFVSEISEPSKLWGCLTDLLRQSFHSRYYQHPLLCLEAQKAWNASYDVQNVLKSAQFTHHPMRSHPLSEKCAAVSPTGVSVASADQLLRLSDSAVVPVTRPRPLAKM